MLAINGNADGRNDDHDDDGDGDLPRKASGRFHAFDVEGFIHGNSRQVFGQLPSISTILRRHPEARLFFRICIGFSGPSLDLDRARDF